MKKAIYLVIALSLWVGSVFAWGMESSASFDWGALEDNPSNADIYPIENRQLLGFGLGILLSLAAMVMTYFAGRRPGSKDQSG